MVGKLYIYGIQLPISQTFTGQKIDSLLFTDH